MTDTVNNLIPFVPENTIDPAAGLNISLNTIDALLQVLVQSVGANTPPAGVEGARHIVGTAPTGAWAGQANKLARFLNTAWTFFDARYALNTADGLFYVRPASTWSAISESAALSAVRPITANETLGLAHINTFGVNSTTSNYTSTIPAQATVAWTDDAELHFLPDNTGDITITAAAGVSLNGVVAGSVTLSTKNGDASLKRKGADSWWVGGAIGTPAEQRTALGLGSVDSPTFTALTLSSGQIAFPATQVPSANANTLDDYEEGTWTPTLTFATPGDLSVAYSSQNGSYTKIGRRLIIDVLVQTSSFTHTTASGSLQIAGVPFSAGSSSYGDCNFNGITKSGYGSVALSQPFGGTIMSLVASGSGVARSAVVAADVPTGGTIVIAGAIAPNT